MNEQDTILSLRLSHPSADLGPLCRSLGLTPRVIWKQGDERRTPKGTPIGGVRDSSYCSIHFGDRSTQPLDRKIRAALAWLAPHRETLRDFTASGGRANFSIGWFCESMSGEHFDLQMLDAMTDLRISLGLSVYALDESEAKRPRFRVSHLRDIGWDKWDPIGIKDAGGPRDEYDNYLFYVVGLLQRGGGDAACIDYLVDIEANHMGLGIRPNTRQRATDTVLAIKQYLATLPDETS